MSFKRDPKLEDLLSQLRDAVESYKQVRGQLDPLELPRESRQMIEMACNLQFIRGSLEARIINLAVFLHDPAELYRALDTIRNLS
jgi:hypothetical protein